MRCLCCTEAKTYHCKVVLLDDQELLQEIQSCSKGQVILETVFRHLSLLETSYFGLRYVDCDSQTHWLDATKKVTKQLKGKDSFTLYFGVKFYAADPCKLLEEITRYQFFLQVKQDIFQGRLPVSNELIVELGAYAVQSELGDYDPRRHSPGYVSEFRFIANQTAVLEDKVALIHKQLKGQLPAVSELNFLDKVKWLDMYGVDLHPVIGEDNVEYFLGLCPTGVIVLRNKSRVANYYWSRISKIYYKGKYFMLRLCDKNNEENTYGFETPSRAACKHLYKCCTEHQCFFQLIQVKNNAPDVVNTRFGSGKFDKVNGRSSQMGRNPPSFTRIPSRRYQRRIVEGAASDELSEEKYDEKPIVGKKSLTPDDVKSLFISTPIAHPRSDSPRSTRSAPWGHWSNSAAALGGGGGGIARHSGSHSPRSVRSAGPYGRMSHVRNRRQSSAESQSSGDESRCGHRRRSHHHHGHQSSSRRGSDNESELSKCSGHSHISRHRRHRKSSGSDHDYCGRRYKLIDSESQWKEVQRRQIEGAASIHRANVVRSRSGYANSAVETESDMSASCHHHGHQHHSHRRKSRRHRSPSDNGKTRLPAELKEHFEFQLVDTEGMSVDQLREIPYTVVKTNEAAKAVRVRLSPSGKPKASLRRPKSGCLKDGVEGSPPPPYSENPAAMQQRNKSSQFLRSSNDRLADGVVRTSSSSALHESSSTAILGQDGYYRSSRSREDVTTENWLNDSLGISNMVIGLPPQPYRRQGSYNNVPQPLQAYGVNYSNSAQNGQKFWSGPEVRNVPNGWSQTYTPTDTDRQQNGMDQGRCMENPGSVYRSKPPMKSNETGLLKNRSVSNGISSGNGLSHTIGAPWLKPVNAWPSHQWSDYQQIQQQQLQHQKSTEKIFDNLSTIKEQDPDLDQCNGVAQEMRTEL